MMNGNRLINWFTTSSSNSRSGSVNRRQRQQDENRRYHAGMKIPTTPNQSRQPSRSRWSHTEPSVEPNIPLRQTYNPEGNSYGAPLVPPTEVNNLPAWPYSNSADRFRHRTATSPFVNYERSQLQENQYQRGYHDSPGWPYLQKIGHYPVAASPGFSENYIRMESNEPYVTLVTMEDNEFNGRVGGLKALCEMLNIPCEIKALSEQAVSSREYAKKYKLTTDGFLINMMPFMEFYNRVYVQPTAAARVLARFYNLYGSDMKGDYYADAIADTCKPWFDCQALATQQLCEWEKTRGHTDVTYVRKYLEDRPTHYSLLRDMLLSWPQLYRVSNPNASWIDPLILVAILDDEIIDRKIQDIPAMLRLETCFGHGYTGKYLEILSTTLFKDLAAESRSRSIKSVRLFDLQIPVDVPCSPNASAATPMMTTTTNLIDKTNPQFELTSTMAATSTDR